MTSNAKAPALPEPILDREPILESGPLGAELLEMVQRPTVVWRPDQGDAQAISGKVVSVTTAISNFGPYPIVDLDDGTRIWRINVLGQVFAREIEFRSVGEGRWVTKLAPDDMFAVFDTGERVTSKTAGRSSYRLVRTIHRPAQGAPIATEAPTLGEIVDEDIPF